MTATITPPAAEHEDVLGLGADAALAFVVEQRRRQDAAAAQELRGVTHWADLHRVDRVGAVHPDLAQLAAERARAAAPQLSPSAVGNAVPG